MLVVSTQPALHAAKYHTDVSLISDTTSINPGKTFDVGVQLKMDSGWHTYWKNPGDSGLPTSIEWKLPPGFTAGPIQWPAPEKISTPPLVSYGYEKEVLLITTIQAPADLKPGTKVEIGAKVSWLECSDVCIPGKADVKTTVTATNSNPQSAFASGVNPFEEARFEKSNHHPELKIQATGYGKNLFLAVENTVPWSANTEAYFFADQQEAVESAAPQMLKVDSTGLIITLELQRPTSAPSISTLSGILSVNGLNVPVSAPIQPLSASPFASGSERLLGDTKLTPFLSLIFAFLGGLILNLLPCVLPVLSLKVLNLVQRAEDGNRSAWKHGTAFTAGVVMSFWILAGVLLSLRSAGQELGWGFQMQSPTFIAGLAILFFLFALNLLGVFELGASLVGIDNRAARQGGVWGSFGMGALATIAATPCTAPFMGAAIGFAVAQSTKMAFLVFTSLGLGMSAPYFILSVCPTLLHFVPKAGAWMESFKQFLGFLLLGTVVFLLGVFGQQLDAESVVMFTGALLVLAVGAWIYGRWVNPTRAAGARFLGTILAVVILFGGVFWSVRIAANGSGPGLTWEPYSTERLAALRAEGKPVFVDFTAAWCLSCKVNEVVAIDTEAVRKKFTESGVVLMKGDWTKSDPAITKALADFGRNGVPLYVLYGSDRNASPQVLPEVLTQGIVLDALNKLK